MIYQQRVQSLLHKQKMLAPDGNVYTVDQSEVQQATANGWRRV